MKKYAITIIITLAIVINLTSNTYAFDGERKGFFLGGEIGLHKTDCTLTVTDGYYGELAKEENSSNGLGLGLKIGGGFNNHVVLYGFSSAIGFNDTDFYGNGTTMSFAGVGTNIYFDSTEASQYITLNLGKTVLDVPDAGASIEGNGISFGTGYAFNRYVAVQADYLMTTIKDGEFIEIKGEFTVFKVTLQVTMF